MAARSRLRNGCHNRIKWLNDCFSPRSEKILSTYRMNKWILLVEDDKDIQASLLDLLEMEGYVVRAAFDGRQALELLQNCQQLPSLILLDLVMRGMDGKEFRTRQLQDPRLADIPVVIMSADGEPANHVADEGVTGYLRKPADVTDILDVIARHMRSTTAT
jgi:two-component system response regulator MprA